MEWLIATLASFAAGLVDAIVGGGGLILIPALFATFPDTSPATLFGTNKSAAVWGTGMSAWQYAQRVRLRWAVLLPAFVCALLGSLLGAWTVTQVDPGFLRRLLPLVLLGVLVYTLRRKDLGTESRNLHTQHVETLLMGIIALVIGFYDGFFGPGTGSFMLFAFLLVGFDFLGAAANARALNFASNLAAVVLFAYFGLVDFTYAIPMGISMIVGAWCGARLAIKKGSSYVRPLFIAVTTVLIGKQLFDLFGK